MTFQIGIILFALFMLLRTWRQYGSRKVAKQWLLLWSIVWAVILAVAIAPQTADVIASIVGVGRGADLFVYIAILFLLYVEFRTLVRTKRLQEEHTEIIRHMAIANVIKPKE